MRITPSRLNPYFQKQLKPSFRSIISTKSDVESDNYTSSLEKDNFLRQFSSNLRNRILISKKNVKTIENQKERSLCVDLCKAILIKNRKIIPKDIQTVAKLYDAQTGFYGEAFRFDKKQNGMGIVNQFYIVYKGTNDLNDIVSDAQISKGDVPDQLTQAMQFYQTVLDYCTDAKNGITNPRIICTGHSLGGSLSQLVAAKYNVEAFSFNSPGMKKQLDKLSKLPSGEANKITINPQNLSKIKNYSIKTDIIGNYGMHIGEFFLIEPLKKYLNFIPFGLHLDFETLKKGSIIGKNENRFTMTLNEILAP